MTIVTIRRSGRALLGIVAVLLLSRLGPSPSPAAPAPPDVDFDRQIRPLLSEHCYTCHGPDVAQRKAKLRLDTKEGAFGELRSGGRAIVPGKPDESELVRRVSSTDPDEVMPPPGKAKPLTASEIDVLKRWVAAGAPWNQHWAFQ
ncbi:MAG TPA: c-type cytochrome domain-containing protein, partial [Gemmataceae bacterium]|nr:c-type cytochrome domain-containing protein [Gemmataceae bacterium]